MSREQDGERSVHDIHVEEEVEQESSGTRVDMREGAEEGERDAQQEGEQEEQQAPPQLIWTFHGEMLTILALAWPNIGLHLLEEGRHTAILAVAGQTSDLWLAGAGTALAVWHIAAFSVFTGVCVGAGARAAFCSPTSATEMGLWLRRALIALVVAALPVALVCITAGAWLPRIGVEADVADVAGRMSIPFAFLCSISAAERLSRAWLRTLSMVNRRGGGGGFIEPVIYPCCLESFPPPLLLFSLYFENRCLA